MKKIDYISLFGFTSSFSIYYINKSTQFLNSLNLNDTLYNWTIGGAPEYFTGLLGVRIANYTGKLYEKLLNNDKINSKLNKITSKNINNILKNIKKNHLFYSTIAASTLIMGLGSIDETIYNLSGGTQDLEDIIKYGLGIGTAIYYNYNYEKN